MAATTTSLPPPFNRRLMMTASPPPLSLLPSSSSHQQQMTMSSLSPSSLELELWKNICRASAYYQHAQRLTLSSNYEYNGIVEDNTNVLLLANTATLSTPQSFNNNDVGVRQNQRLLAAINDAECAYKLYHSCHKHVMTMSTCRLSSTSPGGVMILQEDGGNGITNDAIPKQCINKGCETQTTATTINLELRLAQTLRLLATLHASSNSDDVKNSSNLEMAIEWWWS